MENKTKNIIIILLSVLLFVSFMFNLINFKPIMHNRMENNMMQRNFPNMNNMPNDRNQQRPDNPKQDNNQNNEKQDNEQNQNIQ